MRHEVTYRRDAVKTLRRMQPAKAEDITTAVERIAADPFAPNNNVRPLKGITGGFRIRGRRLARVMHDRPRSAHD